MVLPPSPPSKRIKLESSPDIAEIEKPVVEDPELEGDHCTICLQPIVDRTVIPTCSHEFCFECLALWAEQSRRCPLCSQSIGGYLIHHIRSKYDYQKHYLTPLRTSPPPLQAASGHASQAPAHRRPSRRERRWGRGEREQREQADALDRAISRRRWLYEHDLYAKHVASNSYTRYRPYPSPAQFSASPDLITRATMFLRRELRVWPNLDVEFLTTFVLSLMKSIDIRSESAVKLLAEFLDMDAPYTPGGRHTNAEHFAHEIYSYLRSPYRDLAVYDTVVQYDVPSHIPPPPIYERSSRWEPEATQRPRTPSRSRSPSLSVSSDRHSSRSSYRRSSPRRKSRSPTKVSRPHRHRSRSSGRRNATDDREIIRHASSLEQELQRHVYEEPRSERGRTSHSPIPLRPRRRDKGKRPRRSLSPERDATPVAELRAAEVVDLRYQGRSSREYQQAVEPDPAMPAAGPSRLHAERKKTFTMQDKSTLPQSHVDLDTLEPGNAGRNSVLLPDSSGIEIKDEGAGPRRKPRTRNLLDSIHAHLRTSSTSSAVSNGIQRSRDIGPKHNDNPTDVEERMSTLPAERQSSFPADQTTTSGKASLLSRISMTLDVATPTAEDDGDGAQTQAASGDSSPDGLRRMSAPEIMARTRARLAERKAAQAEAHSSSIPAHDSTLTYVAAPSTSPSLAPAPAAPREFRARLLSKLETERRLTGTGDSVGVISGDAAASSESERVEARLRAQARVRVRIAAARRSVGAQDASSGSLTPRYGARDRDGKESTDATA
ncbi:hypothetical protein EVG20_g6997 [Dentipellis fragilis]|uniref:RING-type E3 ubiquitin transferase n=1 Tax=Dentipellis fragilis TaxID=205917 RepID=A0A4Y9YJ05_9AGAM|nr:hypothetical protein EVG20_g6997 [Dentipellis fragilis]